MVEEQPVPLCPRKPVLQHHHPLTEELLQHVTERVQPPRLRQNLALLLRE
jgi:hypothetical protein